ncbi:MAG TPA: prenyltransferase [Planctomycetaceae bacterium]|nr:prenyltransferase [Planctomycetaceae bacterium]
MQQTKTAPHNNINEFDARRTSAPKKFIWPYLAILRPLHWSKNILVLVGVFAAVFQLRGTNILWPVWQVVNGFIAACLLASSNYVINEILDAHSDRHHPIKYQREFASGNASILIGYLEWIVLILVGIWMSWRIGHSFLIVTFCFLTINLLYNIPPVRLKDRAYIDTLCEGANSPIRILMGWLIVLPNSFPSIFLLLAFWMAGGAAMTFKRIREYRIFASQFQAGEYRRSFINYTPRTLHRLWMFYCLSSVLLFVLLSLVRLSHFLKSI